MVDMRSTPLPPCYVCVLSASEHIMRDACTTKQHAAIVDTRMLEASNHVLGKQVPDVAMCHIPAKNGGAIIALAQHRCHIGIWTAWLSKMPSIMRDMALDDIVHVIDKCPNMGKQLSIMQLSVADSASLVTLGLRPLADSLRSIVSQNKSGQIR